MARLSAVLMLSVMLLSLGVSQLAQEAPPQPIETETRTGTMAAGKSTSVTLEAKGYGGELLLKSIAAPGSEVKAGDTLAVIEAPQHAEELKNAGSVLIAARARLSLCEANLDYEITAQALRVRRAKFSYDAAVSAKEVFDKGGKQERITSAELGVQYNKDSIEDQEDELRQLEALYKGNDLAQESQDIVLKRAKRRLEQSRTRLKLVLSDFDRLVKIELPREELNLQLNVDNAKHEFEVATRRAAEGLTEWKGHCFNARNEVDAATKRQEQLKALKDSWEIKAPHGGLVLHPSDAGLDGITPTLAAGQKLWHGQALATILDVSTLRVTVAVDPRAVRLAKLQRNTAKVEVFDQGISLEARVMGISRVVKDEKVAITLEVTPGESGLMHGQKVSVTFSAKK